ncbi:MAG: MATE family efflux transporter [Roseicyclus sp.]|nr:MATE family efflux transporter [Roseicyclus sp.]MBO6623528.1 MATE family efflux transporter [Roseicyclus sp.]MBO6923807.1 MATE family efflux transporter [Roseicyclus sp.]
MSVVANGKPGPPPSGGRTRAEVMPLLRLSMPLIIAFAAATLIGVIDTVMIAPLGTVPLAAAGITTAFLIILISALWGLVTIVGVRIAQAHGAGDAGEVASNLRNGLALCAIGGAGAGLLMVLAFPFLDLLDQPPEVLAILLPYWLSMALWLVPILTFFAFKALFDTVGRPWTGVAISYLGVVVNLPLNYGLIHVAGLGLVGAGIASVLSSSATLLVAWLFWRRSPDLAAYRVAVPIRWSRIRSLYREGLPICIGYAGEGAAYAFLGIMLGWFGAVELAANQVVNAIGGVFYVIPLGMASAVSIRIGMAIGGKERARLRPILAAALWIVTLWMLAITALYIFGGRAMSEALTKDGAVVDVAVGLFIVAALVQVADGVQSSTLGALRGMSDNRVPTAITLISYWPLALPAAYVIGFPLGYGAIGVWAGYGAGIGLAAILLSVRFWRKTGSAPGR